MWSWFWWGLGAFGIGGLAFGAVVLVLGWPAVFAFSRTKVGQGVIAIASAGAGLVWLYLKARADERAAQEAKANAAILEAQRRRAEIESRVDAMPDDAVRERLRNG